MSRPIQENGVLAFRRIVVKAGTKVLTGRTEQLDRAVLVSLAAQTAQARAAGAQVVLVTSGAIAAGREALAARSPERGVLERQVLAAVGQGLLMHAYQEAFAPHGVTVGQALLTHHDVEDRQGYLNVRNTLEGLLTAGVIPIVNENDVVDTAEIRQERFGDNDALSSLVANLIDADLLLMLTDSGGLFTADPHRDPGARLVERVDAVDDAVLALAQPTPNDAGRGGMLSKLLAAERSASAGVAVILAGGHVPDVVMRAARGEPVGTLFPARVTAMESRKRWLLSGLAESGGELVVDDGAVAALRKRHGSLLPAGLRGVKGAFRRGDVVAVVSESGERVACGIASYDNEELAAISGARSSEIPARLGHHYGDEAVHRNNMVVL